MIQLNLIVSMLKKFAHVSLQTISPITKCSDSSQQLVSSWRMLLLLAVASKPMAELSKSWGAEPAPKFEKPSCVAIFVDSIAWNSDVVES